MDEVAEVKLRLEITEVVGAYVPLKQSGRNLKAPCPFHQEKTASFMVSPEKGIYHCFGCGEGGDIFTFVQKMEGLDFRGALEMLARKAGVELVARGGENKEAQRLRGRLLDAHELAVKYFQASLMQNPKALEYVVKKRGLKRETVKEFQIGYGPESWEALTGFLQKKGFTMRELLQGGLAGQKEGRNTVYDLFRGRIMFTICDREGRPIGFTGRVLDDSVPKYLNTPQTPLYDKSQAIYGLHLAKEAIRQTDEVVLVEGNMDVIASHQAGVKQVVAASGTALTLDQLRTLSKLTKNIKLAFDADRAGLAATERAIEMGQKLGLTLRMVEMPEGFKDADELIAEDVAIWEREIADAKYIVDYLFDRFEKDFDLSSAVGKRGYTDRLMPIVRHLGDAVEQDHYMKLLAEKTSTNEEAVRAKVLEQEIRPSGSVMGGPAITHESEPVRRAVVQSTGKPSMRTEREKLFLGLNLMYNFARGSLDDLAVERFSSDSTKNIFKLLMSNRDLEADKIISSNPDIATELLSLQLIAEDFPFSSELELSTQVFVLAKGIFKESNDEFKKMLMAEMQLAQERQDKEMLKDLREKVDKLIESEARYSV
jgi:DNA primase